jgi:hypothetical protein
MNHAGKAMAIQESPFPYFTISGKESIRHTFYSKASVHVSQGPTKDSNSG